MTVHAVLEAEGLTIQFGGHVVVDSVDLQVPDGQFLSIIGPNGAGKTTLFNLLSGELFPTRGRVRFKGTDVTRLSPTLRARLGIGRSFQLTHLFPNLTVREHVRLAVQSRAGVRYHLLRRASAFSEVEEKTDRLLETVLLAHKRDHLAMHLTHGEKRKLEIAMLLALEPNVLLLDEPTAGMAIEEVPAILEVIRWLKETERRTIVLIEHKLDLVFQLSDRIAVLSNGKVIAEGTPGEIVRDERVQQAYMGGHCV